MTTDNKIAAEARRRVRLQKQIAEVIMQELGWSEKQAHAWAADKVCEFYQYFNDCCMTENIDPDQAGKNIGSIHLKPFIENKYDLDF